MRDLKFFRKEVLGKTPFNPMPLKERHRGKDRRLLDLHFGASSFELLLDLFSFFFLGTFLDFLRSALNELLRFSQAEAGNNAAHFFNDGDFVSASIHEDDVELSLLFSSGCRSSGTASSGDSDRSSGANAPLLFEGFDEFCDFEDGKAAQFFNDFCKVCHNSVSVSPLPEASGDLREKAFAPARNHWVLGSGSGEGAI
jgi:hypothetical protein